MSTQETITRVPIRVRALSPCMVCLETFPKKTLIKDGTCDDGICKSCIKGITNGKCPNCREVYPWWSTPPNDVIGPIETLRELFPLASVINEHRQDIGSLQNELMDPLQNELEDLHNELRSRTIE